MERPHTLSSNLKSIAGTALAGIVVLVLLGNLDCAVAQWDFCAAAGNALGVLPCLALAACQAMQTYVFDHGLLGWLLQMLLSLWTLLPVVGGAI
jgi:hypothetical protein